jgi:hypothetical protein
MGGSLAIEATLETQNTLSTALPIRFRKRTGLRKRNIS